MASINVAMTHFRVILNYLKTIPVQHCFNIQVALFNFKSCIWVTLRHQNGILLTFNPSIIIFRFTWHFEAFVKSCFPEKKTLWLTTNFKVHTPTICGPSVSGASVSDLCLSEFQTQWVESNWLWWVMWHKNHMTS